MATRKNGAGRPPNDPGPDTLARLCRPGVRALRRPARTCDVDQAPCPDWLGGVSWFSWGRLRYAHTQGLFFGWLGNAFLAFLYFAVPRLAGRPVTAVRLGWALFAIFNGLLVLPRWD